jgi:Ca-activated chloride channel family protein
MVLLTDGSNTAGKVQPLTAAKLAADNNITIYTVGVGADEMLQPGIFGSSFGARRVNPSADLDEKTLQAIAKQTGGKYFRARNPNELVNIYQLLDELEPVEDNEQTFRPTQALFYWPLAAAFLLSLFTALIMLPWKIWFNAVFVPAAGEGEQV